MFYAQSIGAAISGRWGGGGVDKKTINQETKKQNKKNTLHLHNVSSENGNRPGSKSMQAGRMLQTSGSFTGRV